MTDLLQIRDLVRHFKVPGQGWRSRPQMLKALDGVSLTLRTGETLGIVGESGSGKSTLARLAVGLDRPTDGSIHLDGEDLAHASPQVWRAMRRKAQYIFQDSAGSLNPRLTVGEQIREGLEVHDIGTPAERKQAVVDALRAVALEENFASRYPHQLSGGQQQRVVIARAIILKPHLLVADEPVSALDLTVQAQIVKLLMDLQADTGAAMMLISHDLKVVRRAAERVVVLYLGRVVEEGNTAALFEDPRHPYTIALLAAAPRPRKERAGGSRFRIQGDPPSPMAVPAGCPLHPRCPLAIDICRKKYPEPFEIRANHRAACHRAQATPSLTGTASERDHVHA